MHCFVITLLLVTFITFDFFITLLPVISNYNLKVIKVISNNLIQD